MKCRILEVSVFCFALALTANAQMPSILSEPQSATNNSASAAGFTVVATNAASYQWCFQGAPLPGATNSAMALDNLSSSDAGSYTVIVTSAGNLSVTSSPPAVLTVVPGTVVQFTIGAYFDGGSKSFSVQLFDHDKPATVENFIHYITAGAYSNMFFDRDVTGFVLQGGDYVTAGRSTNPVSVVSIKPGTNFPSQVDNEFSVGPLVHNRFGTIAMAKISGKPDSATSAFFFNLADNSTNLDNNNSGFTVFGRIIDSVGSNDLQYFSSLSSPNNGIFDYSSSMPTLPVNYYNTNVPTDASLFYCSFTFQTPAPVDATAPTVSITSPAANAVITNIGALTVTGTASDDVGLAEVFCIVTSPSGVTTTNAVTGTTNWSLNLGNLAAGTYQVTAYAQDGAGNLSAPAAESFTAMIPTGTLVQITFSGFPDGSSSNVVVQLFDSEKPATVANFLHYIRPASYFYGFENYVAFTNMVWDRCIPGFVLQGGDYKATDQTNTIPPTDLASTLTSIFGAFTESSFFSPVFAGEVDNEFNAGPVIHNTFGTLATAKQAGYPDSAANGFFFNLADNSAKLDSQNGGYTVFGQIISGSNVLQYFNTLSKPVQGIFDSTAAGTNTALTDLPVNYNGWGKPADANLFFGGFTVLSPYSPDTVAPVAAISYPANGETMTNADVLVQGTASDNTGLANVVCTCSGSNFSRSIYATGTTNWTAYFPGLPPGQYTNVAYAQDGSGNYSANANNTFSVPRFAFSSSVAGNGSLSTNLTGTNTIVGDTYTITATPGKGAVFVNWSYGTNASLKATETFTMTNGLDMTANFISNNVRGGVLITSPVANASLTNTSVTISGRVAPILGEAQVSCQIFSAYYGTSVSSNMVINTSGLWSTPAVSLPPGYYIAQAVARGVSGRGSVITQEFAVLAPLTVKIYGRGRTTIGDGAYLRVGLQYTEDALPAAGESFFSWNQGNGALALQSFPFIMEPGKTLTVTFISNSLPGKLTLTSPAINSTVTTPTVNFTGKITTPAQVACQLFQNDLPLTAFLPATVTGTTWTLPVTNLPMGIYNVVALATAASGQTTLVEHQFTLNLCANISGTYNGLFFNPSAISATSAGYVSFRLTPIQPLAAGNYGLVSGTLTTPARAYAFSGQMNGSGAATVSPTGFNGSLSMTFDVANLSGKASGSVTEAGTPAPLTAYRAVTRLTAETVPSPGHYIIDMQPVTPTNGVLNGPAGDSVAAVTVSAAGAMAAAGTMADDAAFSHLTSVFTNGVWPLYATLSKGNGMLIGWETNMASGECSGALYWIKTAGNSAANGAYYVNGLTEQLNSIGASFVKPGAGTPWQIVFGGGTLTNSVTNEFTFNAAGVIVPASGTTDNLKGSLVAATPGVITGSIVNPLNDKTLNFSGAFVSPAQGGGGFTLDANGQTGYFDITTAPPLQ